MVLLGRRPELTCGPPHLCLVYCNKVLSQRYVGALVYILCDILV